MKIMKKLIQFLTITFFVTQTIQGQVEPEQNFINIQSKKSLPEIIPPSPNVANLMKFEEVPVDYYTGNPNVAIPLFSKAISGINYDLTLAYNPSGVRVDERSAWVGTGWTLNEGGAISRSIVGLPDDINIPNKSIGVFYNNFFNFSNLTQFEKDKFVWSTQNGRERLDNNLDIYQFNFLGRTGRFIIIKNQAGQLEAKIVGADSKLKISISTLPNSFTISKFVVTDEKGYKFTFDVTETTSTVSHSIRRMQLLENVLAPAIESYDNTSFISAWKIKRIETPDDIVICEFYYENDNQSVTTPYNFTSNKLLNPLTNFGSLDEEKAFNDGVLLPQLVTSWNELLILSKKIKLIQFRDNTIFLFNTSSSHPEGGYLLSSFSVYQNTQPIVNIEQPTDSNSKFITQFDFTYETNNKLFLTQVKQISGAQELVHTLSYENKEQLEGYGSVNKDDYGYYNGGDFKNSNKTHLKKGVLSSITYPTGGVKEFYYEPNTFGFVGNKQLAFEELFGNSDNRVPLSLNKLYETNVQTLNYNDPMIIYIPVDQDVESITSNLYGNELFLSQCSFVFEPKKLLPGIPFNPFPAPGSPQPTFTASQFIDDFERQGGGFPLTISPNPITTFSFLKKGFYFVRLFKVDQLVNPATPNHLNGDIKANLQIKYSTLKTTGLSKFLFGGGLRIGQITYKDLGIIKERTVFDYTKLEIDPLDNIDGILSSGSMDAKTFKRKYNLNWTDFYLVGCRTTIDVSYEVTELSNPITVQQTKGGYVGYKDVTVKKVNGLDFIGRTEYTYTSPLDYTVYPQLYDYPFIPVLDTDYKRGNLKKTVVFNKQGQILNEKTNNYSFFENTVYTQLYTGKSGTGSNPWDRYYDAYQYSFLTPNKITNGSPSCIGGGSFFTPSELPNLNVGSIVTSIQNHITGDARLTWSETKEYFYNGNANHTVSISEYEYNNLNNQIKKEKLNYNENGSNVLLEKNYTYAIDNFNDVTTSESIAKSTMININRVNDLMHTSVFKNGVYLNSEKIGYKVFTTNLVLPETIYTSKAQLAGGSGMTGIPEVFEPRLKYNRYDTFGNPLEVQQVGGMLISYIWGYNKTVPIAKIENASNAQIQSALGVTNYDSLTEANLSTINSLRTLLPNAMVTTFTYKPQIGVETITDPKGYVMTYSYDEFNRLNKVTDADGKIITENLYRYRTQN